MLHLILMVLGLVLFLLEGIGVSYPRVQMGWIGAACVTGALLLR